jgi:hypothetical protein
MTALQNPVCKLSNRGGWEHSRRAVKAHRLSADVHILAQKVATTLQPDPKKGLV